MNFDDFTPSAHIISSLYKSNIVIVDEGLNRPQKPVSKPEPLKFLGNNNANLSILFYDESHAFLNEPELNLLTKMLEACNKNLADAALVNIAHTYVAFNEVLKELHPKILLVFGNEPLEMLPISFPVYRPTLYNGCIFIASAPLHQLLQNSDDIREQKKQLWACLKQVFNL